MISLSKKVVLVIGASSGIGKAAAHAFGQRGASVVVAARREEKIIAIANQMKIQGVDALAIRCDASNDSDVTVLFDKVVKCFGRVDVVVNCVGKGLKQGILEITTAQWKSVYQTNVNSVFYVTQKAVAAMSNSGGGHIITISSMAGKINIPGYSGYCSSKHAVTSFLKCVKLELLRKHIKVSIIHPYKVDTEFFDSYEKRPSRAQMLSPSDMAEYIVAVAQRNVFKCLGLRLINVLRRVYYLLRFSISNT